MAKLAKHAPQWEKVPDNEIKAKTKVIKKQKIKKVDIKMEKRCRNCQIVGHFSRDCSEPKREKICPPELKCRACDKEGHFARDCKEERKEGFVLKEKPAKAPRTCRNCNEVGHFVK